MANFEIKGTLYHIGAIQELSEKFSKREFIIETDDQYAPFIKLELTQDRVHLIESYSIGAELTATFNVKGSKSTYTNKNGQTDCFVCLQAWKLSSDSAPKGASGKPMTKVSDLPKETAQTEDDKDQLPFL